MKSFELLILALLAVGWVASENYMLRQENGHLARAKKDAQIRATEATDREEAWRQAYYRSLIVPDEEAPYTQPSGIERTTW
jgi:hypothetical protein